MRLDADLIDWPMPQHFAAEVEYQTVYLAWMQAKAPAYHLVIEAWRHRRP